MEAISINDSHAAFLFDGAGFISRETAEEIIRSSLREHNIEPWKSMYIDEYTYLGSTLLLARPGAITHIRLADYAPDFLKEYFTE